MSKGKVSGRNRFSRNVIYLGLTSMVNDISSEMISPVLPIFLMNLGASSIVIGLVSGSRKFFASALEFVSGYAVDRLGKRKPFIYAGYLTSSLSKFLLAFSRTWPVALVLTSLDRVGKGVRTPARDAIVAESMPRAHGKGFGIHRALDTFGAVIGSTLALILIWQFSLSPGTILLIAGAISLFSLIPLLRVREPIPHKFRKKDNHPVSKRFKLFVIVSFVFALANFSYMFFLLGVKDMLGSEVLSTAYYVLFNVVYALLAKPMGELSDRYGRKRVLVFGYSVFGLSCLTFILAFLTVNNVFFLIIPFVLYGVANAVVNANQRAFVSDLTDQNTRGAAFGIYHGVTSISALPSGLIAGQLWSINPIYTFVWGAAFSSLAALLLFKV